MEPDKRKAGVWLRRAHKGLIRIDYHKLITCLELQPSTQKLLNVELISLIKV